MAGAFYHKKKGETGMYLILLGIWIILNGKFTLEILAFGLAVCAFLYLFICKFTDYSVKRDWQLIKRLPEIMKYMYLLVKEIIKANLAVIHLILSGREEIQPVLVNFKTDLKTDIARAFLANAITLTPGTITVSLSGDDYVVHCLDQELAYGMDNTVFVLQLAELEKDGRGKRL